jgi:arginine utilization protein RocB
MNKDRILRNLLELCGIPSVSETVGELAMADKLMQMLGRSPYFQQHPEFMCKHEITGDKCGRSFVSAFLQGGVKSPRTVILLSHFDVVGVEEFGMQKELAFDPPAYTQFLKDHPERSLPKEAAEDLESGDYLFGRGVMDMKFGIAAYLEILTQLENDPEHFEGNLLFLSVPDEEANSAGMLAAAEYLQSLKKEKGLEYLCCLISEPHFPKYPGDRTKYLYTGTVGKLLPVFYCVGKETHACEPLSGLNPNRLTAKIIEKLDADSEFSDASCGVTVPPPVCLKQSDMKKAYSVQSPIAAYTYFNFMTLSRTPHEVMQSMVAVSREAFEEVIADLRQKAEKRLERTGETAALSVREAKVLTFRELWQWCREANGSMFEQHMKEFVQKHSMSGGGDLRSFSIEIVQEAHKFCPYRDPMIIVFFAPPFYPHSGELSPDSPIRELSRYIVDLAKNTYQEEIKIEPYFPGLSDMSYLGLPEKLDIDELVQNFPVWDAGYHIPLEAIADLQIPFLNFGPLGKDAHRFTERLCLSYSMEKAAPILWDTVKHLLYHPD